MPHKTQIPPASACSVLNYIVTIEPVYIMLLPTSRKAYSTPILDNHGCNNRNHDYDLMLLI
eukprot:scaffold23018_cov205-Skeletonema_marinoi.AAC.4